MRPRVSPIAIAMALCLAGAFADETKVIQGMYLSLSGTETRGNGSSPFARLPVYTDYVYAALRERPDWNLDSYSYSDYSLRFSTRELSGQVQASAQGGPGSDFALSIDQAWIKATLGEGWGIAFGRRELKWKDGGNWNPSDVVNNYLSWGATGQAQGRDSVELFGLLPFMDFNLDLSAAAALRSGVSDPLELPCYFAVGSILYPLELRAKAALQSGYRPRLGASARLSLSSGELYADGLWLGDNPIAHNFDAASASVGSWFRCCGGADWTFDLSASKLASAISLRLEYLRQDDGLSVGQLGKYFDTLSSFDLASSSGPSDYVREAALWNGRFFALGRDYAFLGFSLSEIAQEHLSLSCGCDMNLDDLSFALQSSLSWSPKNLFTICLSAAEYGGKAGGEALMLPYEAQYSLSLSRSF
jgi:hypothetical protein